MGTKTRLIIQPIIMVDENVLEWPTTIMSYFEQIIIILLYLDTPMGSATSLTGYHGNNQEPPVELTQQLPPASQPRYIGTGVGFFGRPGIGLGMSSIKPGMGVGLMGTGAETRPSGIVEWGKSSDPVSLQYKPQMSAPVPSNRNVKGFISQQRYGEERRGEEREREREREREQ